VFIFTGLSRNHPNFIFLKLNLSIKTDFGHLLGRTIIVMIKKLLKCIMC